MIVLRPPLLRRLLSLPLLMVLSSSLPESAAFCRPQNFQDEAARTLTPRQREIARQQERLSSAEVEERRDAVMKLGLMHHPDASRVALSALNDSSPGVRAAAAEAILSLSAGEAVAALIPLLGDRDEFVRQEVAYVLGKTHSATAVAPLSERLLTDKKDGVRAAAAIALGEIRAESAVPPLAQVLSGQRIDGGTEAKRKPGKEQNEFVLRAAAAALGRIGSRSAVPVLVAVLGNEKLHADVRREAARALGLIGDRSAVPALQTALTAGDPYLLQTASEALHRISQAQPLRQ